MGEATVGPGKFFRNFFIGTLATIPDDLTTLSVVRKNTTGETVLMLGPMRFINSDCEPKCEDDFSSTSGVVKLRVKRPLRKNDEVTVKYREDFF